MLVATLAFFHPLLRGKLIRQSDLILIKGMQRNIEEYRETHNGEDALWSMSMFSGMPAYPIHVQYEGNILRPIQRVLKLGLPEPIGLFFWGMVGFFWLLRLYSVGPYLALAGAFGFGFFSYYIIITEAGHGAKLAALMYSPAVIASIITAFRGKIFLGAALLFFTLGLQVLANHIQMTYYLLMVVVIVGLYELVKAFQEKVLKKFFLTTAALSLAAGLAVAINASHLMPFYEYSHYSIRGKSELKLEPEEMKDPKLNVHKTKRGSGLDKEYAYGWSNDRDELMTLLIPNFKGGSSNGALTKNSHTYQLFESQDPEGIYIKQKQWPLYWGTQAFTSGPTYAGAVVCFLFILGLILVRSGIKWALLYATLLFFLLSLGKNSYPLWEALLLLSLPAIFYFTYKKLKKVPPPLYGALLTLGGIILVSLIGDDPARSFTIKDLFFDYLPIYNKFRAPASMLAIVGITMPWLAILGASAFMDPSIEDKTKKVALLYALGICLALVLPFAFAPDSFFSFTGPSDAQFSEEQKPLLEALIKDRRSLMVADAWRSFYFILVAAALLELFRRKILQEQLTSIGLALAVLIDLFVVDIRFLWKDEYETKQEFESHFQPREADLILKQQDTSYFRVFPLGRNPFNDGRTPYYLKSIGGYNAVKIKRYQQLIEAHISEMNMNVISMLNTKYIITQQPLEHPALEKLYTTRENEIIYKNRINFGPAWIVQDVKVVPTPDDAIKSLDTLKTFYQAVIEQKDAKELASRPFAKDSINLGKEYIRLIKADNRHMQYEFFSDKNRFVVFSEVYYPKGWKAFIDGRETYIFHTNYVLRGLVIPAGKHKVEFKYDPQVLKQSKIISQVASVLLLLTLAGAIFFEIRKIKQASV
ncbi:MAG: YfhO family protein [Bacteroidia bacterium]|nr:YfhO family protein [Bacteroidia bacterium]MDW8158265.1 YfhO family protein [Bacteroidia bacterium]